MVRVAQTETSAVVTGLRETDLVSELANARDVLSAAGIAVRVSGTPLVPSAQAEHLFSLLLREASTNILRHSDASQVTLTWLLDSSTVTLSISNDGVHAQLPSQLGAGSGLSTLRRRFEQANGSLLEEHSGHEFVVRASLPLDTEWSQP